MAIRAEQRCQKWAKSLLLAQTSSIVDPAGTATGNLLYPPPTRESVGSGTPVLDK